VGRLTGGVSPSPGFGRALLTSLLTATISACIIAILGTPLAYLLARSRARTTKVLGVLVALPLALPPLVSGLLLLYVVGPYTTLGRIFGGQLTETRAGIVLAQTFVAAPFFIIVGRSAFSAVDPALEEVAASLGHGRLARFTRVAVPAAMYGLAAGLLLAWLRAFAEFGATIILAYHPYSLPVFTFVQFDASGLPATMLPIASALAAALVLLTLASLRVRRRRPDRERLPSERAPTLSAPQPVPLDFAIRRCLDGFSLDIAHTAKSSRLAVLGPSGAGKTLTLRILAGLAPADPRSRVHAGSCRLDELPAERRGVGYVPQSPALLPRRTVWRQVTFGATASPALAAWWLSRLGLGGLERRYPDELSGGQARRVAIARALAIEPSLLLLDEPFTGIDAPVRERLRRELRTLQRETDVATVIVTHDPQEAAMLADEIIVLSDGRILQAGSRQAVFHAPASPDVAGLLGIANAHRGTVLAPGIIESNGLRVAATTRTLAPGSEVVWSVRPERISLTQDGHYEATLIDDVDLGATRELLVSIGNYLELLVRTDRRCALTIEAHYRIDIPAEDIHVWPAAREDEADRHEATLSRSFV
jgi:ABC-type Fe3+/spermidine/putrescine transport system ATPase subunit/ABC-type sulfate transport system permease component